MVVQVNDVSVHFYLSPRCIVGVYLCELQMMPKDGDRLNMSVTHIYAGYLSLLGGNESRQMMVASLYVE